MFSQLINIGKKLVILTLLTGVLVMPISPLFADEMNMAPVETTTEDSFVTLSDIVITDTLAISAEQNGGTASIVTDDSWAESDENSFITANNQLVDTGVISDEQSFTTSTASTETLVVGDESSFTTQTATIVDDSVVSVEGDFTTLTPIVIEFLAISDENSFTTLTGGDPINTDTLAISDEQSFTTQNSGTDISDLAISDELSFTTNSGGGGGGSGGGSGGGGGGYYTGSGGIVLGAQTTYNCPVYLKKFIKYGEANDRFEVIKLQVFLRVFEGFKDLKITGVYNQETFEAVKIFQTRYFNDVLTPWQLDHPTGFVYITTRLAINNIYCGRDTANDLYFRKQVAYEYYLVTGEDIDEGYYITPITASTTTPTTTVSIVGSNVFLAGLGGLLDFIGDNFCWLLNLLLLLLIFFLLWLLWEASRDGDNNNQITEPEITLPVGAVSLEEIINPADEEELAKLAEEDEIKLEVLDNNPWQEKIQ